MRVVATAGHVDHGKSSLVRALTGTDPDRFEEEQRRGLTIDLGFASATLPSGAEISFVDVPGHVRFLRNMLAGVGGVDACVFVVAATEGWKPQSEEHLRILDLLGIRHGIVVTTMSDLVDDEWLQLQQLEILDHLAGTFLADAPMVAFSSTTGDGHTELVAALDRLVAETPQSNDAQRPRLWIDRVFAARGSGTVVTGTLTGGALFIDQRLDVVPAVAPVRVRRLQAHGVTVEHLSPGSRAAVNLVGIDHSATQRGDALVVAGQWRPTVRLDASLRVLGSLDHEVTRRGAYLAYIGSGEHPVRLRVLGTTGVAPGDTGNVRLYLPHPLPLTPGDRFVLRESGRSETVGGGEVLDVAPVLRASRARPDRDPARVVRERGMIEADDLWALTGTAVEPTVGRWVIDPSVFEAMAAELRNLVAAGGSSGVDLATLTEAQRAVLVGLDGVRVDAGVARAADEVDVFADHPLLAALRSGGSTPPDAAHTPRNDLRELVRRKLIVERDGIYFHADAVTAAARAAAMLLAAAPDGFTMSEFRDAVATTRKYALPLLNELDARGVTRRRGDLRIGGPRLPGE